MNGLPIFFYCPFCTVVKQAEKSSLSEEAIDLYLEQKNINGVERIFIEKQCSGCFYPNNIKGR